MVVVLLVLFVSYLIYLFVYTEMKKSKLERKLNKEFLERNSNKYILMRIDESRDSFLEFYSKNRVTFSHELSDSIIFNSYDETEKAMNKIIKEFPDLRHRFYIKYLD